MKAYVAKHWDEAVEGSGCTVVVAPNENLARRAVIDYLRAKPEGYRQCGSADLLEVETLEDSHLSGWCFDTTEPGIKLEYRMLDEAPYDEIVHVGFDVDAVADELDRLQAAKYEGRGVSCVQTLIFYLRRREFGSARAVANNESDKIRSHEDIVLVLKRFGFWYEIDFSRWDSD